MRTSRELHVWQRAHTLTLHVYRLTQSFPEVESYGLARQVRRAAASIPSNISEGCGRAGNAEFAHFLNISLGSANEVDYQILLSKDLGYISETEYLKVSEDITEIQKMLVAFILKIRPKPSR